MALTDHSLVWATFELPRATASSATAAQVDAAFVDASDAWRTPFGAQRASCGQTGSTCALDRHCCDAAHSWSGVEQYCVLFECGDVPFYRSIKWWVVALAVVGGVAGLAVMIAGCICYWCCKGKPARRSCARCCLRFRSWFTCCSTLSTRRVSASP